MPALVVTSPDRPQGRKMLVTPPPVKVWAEKNGVQCIQPEKLEEDVTEKIISGDFDLSIVVAYGMIMQKKLLESPKLGSINIHYSLLPKYRGASPVESAILNGDIETGISIQQMEFKMDSGPILAQEKIEISPEETAPELRKRLIKTGGELLVKVLPEIVNGNISSVPQDETQATFCKKIAKEDGLLDLNGDPVKNYNKFRAYAKWPRTFFVKDGKRFIVTRAKLEDEKFVIEKVIPEGKKETDFRC